jgi:hypothetical protein
MEYLPGIEGLDEAVAERPAANGLIKPTSQSSGHPGQRSGDLGIGLGDRTSRVGHLGHGVGEIAGTVSVGLVSRENSRYASNPVTFVVEQPRRA